MDRVKQFLLPLAAVLLAALLLFLRRWQLAVGFDSDGIPIAGSAATITLLAVTAVSVLLWILCSRTLKPAASLSSQRSLFAGLIALIGALCIAASGAMSLYGRVQDGLGLMALVDCLGLAAALCLCVSAGLSLQGQQPHPIVRIIPYVFLMVRLVCDFRSWSIDPIVLDYCFRHFGLIFAMCGLYRLTDFSFSAGKRRLAAFWAMGAVCFCTMSVAGLPLDGQLLFGGLALTMLGVLIRLCRGA